MKTPGRVFSILNKDQPNQQIGIKLGSRSELMVVKGNPKGQIEKDLTKKCNVLVPRESAGRKKSKRRKIKRRKTLKRK